MHSFIFVVDKISAYEILWGVTFFHKWKAHTGTEYLVTRRQLGAFLCIVCNAGDDCKVIRAMNTTQALSCTGMASSHTPDISCEVFPVIFELHTWSLLCSWNVYHKGNGFRFESKSIKISFEYAWEFYMKEW